MNKPGSFKRDINYRGWAIAVAMAAGVAELAIKFVFPVIARII